VPERDAIYDTSQVFEALADGFRLALTGAEQESSWS
jgi:hypothetical protein